ncbi:hypothetical protein HF086_008702 [Spodoptera exigua]|uniref:Uncharacterized protein n=1 Tax=Spodoptera exigua TaxID=7107 RepID=A0A922MWF3_SPOEX|nr:hypothetical protein HF086_008702 [Spodoptera exigua]
MVCLFALQVVVQRLSAGSGLPSNVEYQHHKIPDVPYQPTVRENMCFHAITMMKVRKKSFNSDFISCGLMKELRLASESWSDGGAVGGAFVHSGRIPAERLPVRENPDGSYVATWIPRTAGAYVFRCTLDDLPASQEVTIEVAESMMEPAERGCQAGGVLPTTPPTKLRRFIARFSAGLRVRASPSLQAEELGRIPAGANIAFVEEVSLITINFEYKCLISK